MEIRVFLKHTAIVTRNENVSTVFGCQSTVNKIYEMKIFNIINEFNRLGVN